MENKLDEQIIIKTHLDNNKEKGQNIDMIINSTIGIYNIGNTCFINSVVQILIHCKIFMKNF